jgi:hypothetical protein
MRNQFPQGGGWSDSMGAFLFMFDFPTFPQGAEELPGKSESPKIAAGKNAAWEGSTGYGGEVSRSGASPVSTRTASRRTLGEVCPVTR